MNIDVCDVNVKVEQGAVVIDCCVICCQERAQRAQILDLETQLNQMKAECLKAKHDKEEVSAQ